MFTGNKDIDIQILLKLNDTDLNNFCIGYNHNEYFKSLCNQESLWRQKVYHLTTPDQYEYVNLGKKYLEFSTWKDLYNYVLVNSIYSVVVDEDSIEYTNKQIEKIKVFPEWINREPFILKLKRLQVDYMGIDMNDHDFNVVFGGFWEEIRKLNNF